MYKNIYFKIVLASLLTAIFVVFVQQISFLVFQQINDEKTIDFSQYFDIGGITGVVLDEVYDKKDSKNYDDMLTQVQRDDFIQKGLVQLTTLPMSKNYLEVEITGLSVDIGPNNHEISSETLFKKEQSLMKIDILTSGVDDEIRGCSGVLNTQLCEVEFDLKNSKNISPQKVLFESDGGNATLKFTRLPSINNTLQNIDIGELVINIKPS
ncbi:MAG: hypothetical protein U0525_01555 [Patescibacteria group bacterium]